MNFDPNDPTNLERLSGILNPCTSRQERWTVRSIALAVGWIDRQSTVRESGHLLKPIREFLASHPDKFWLEEAVFTNGGTTPYTAYFWHAIPCRVHPDCIIRATHES